MDPINLLYLIPISMITAWIKVLSSRLDKMKETTYTKTETQEMIRLHQEPMNIKIENIDNNTKEMKRLLERVLNESKQKT